MDLTTSHYIQLIIGLFLGVVVFVFAYRAPIRISVPLLILLIPFQSIDSKYGSLNMVLTFLLGAALFLSGRLRRVPMLGFLFAIMLAYLVSLIQVHRMVWFDNILYLVALASTFLLFYIVYNFVRDVKDPRHVVHILIMLNMLVVIYCILQIFAGKHFALLGIDELRIHNIRSGSREPRLTGPFGSVGLTAEYLVLTILLIGYELIHTKMRSKKILLSILVAANLGLLVATGNRGGFLSLIGGMLVFLYLFRRELGLSGILRIISGGIVLLLTASVVIISYTELGTLYDRLERTEVEGGIPDSRSRAWPAAVENIKNKPFLGHGPYMRLYTESQSWKSLPTTVQPLTLYPHNLYLYLLYTVGAVGLVAVLAFFIGVSIRLWKTSAQLRYHNHRDDDLYLEGLLRLGLLLILVFLIDQIKVEFLRSTMVAYWHFVFCLIAILVGFADIAKRCIRVEVQEAKETTSYIPEFQRGTRDVLGH